MEKKQATKESLLAAIEDLSAERLNQVLDFALFIKERQQAGPKAYELNTAGTTYPLKDTVICYDAPFEPVAHDDWETET